MKLCLGTAQFGLDYGINNFRGKIPRNESVELLQHAHDNGITSLDTASAYGDSETVLGESIHQTGKEFQIITKYPVNADLRPSQWIGRSLKTLQTEKVYGCLFHNYIIFRNNPEYIEDFVNIKQTGKCEKIGFSLYYPSEAEYILKNNIPCDIVQVPYNIFDQRFACLFPELKDRGIEIYARSIFLQGLFFIEPGKLGERFAPVKALSCQIHQMAHDNSADIAMLCLGFAQANQNIAYTVIGIDSLDNLKENINNYNRIEKTNINYSEFERFAVSDENIILPFNWKQ